MLRRGEELAGESLIGLGIALIRVGVLWLRALGVFGRVWSGVAGMPRDPAAAPEPIDGAGGGTLDPAGCCQRGYAVRSRNDRTARRDTAEQAGATQTDSDTRRLPDRPVAGSGTLQPIRCSAG
ncbi:hypothetical protein Pa4123_52020 [Phytohabitans aurantiacus]|uniref:Uncharacterized protein n=1 Tax=Phytohabitans aurantiacus TaxID=3016789 RepID=A0ABQ5QZE1_9ACTN|nr:hypothetical protein Pa4123_52020 [Phytohabitans aurantiacus]